MSKGTEPWHPLSNFAQWTLRERYVILALLNFHLLKV